MPYLIQAKLKYEKPHLTLVLLSTHITGCPEKKYTRFKPKLFSIISALKVNDIVQRKHYSKQSTETKKKHIGHHGY